MFHILVVEDEVIERETLTKILREHIGECIVDEAKHGKEALALYAQQQYDVVCADINMPGVNGLEMVKEMKKQDSYAHFLIVSSYNYFEYAQEAIRLGVSDFILKPYNIAELVESVIKILEDFHHDHRAYIKQKTKALLPIIKRDLLYAIISNEPEIEIYRRTHLLDKQICSGFCFVCREVKYERDFIEQLQQNFLEANYYFLSEYVHGSLISFVLSTRLMNQEDIMSIVSIFDCCDKRYPIGWGPVVSAPSQFYSSFQIARDHIGSNMDCFQQLSSMHQRAHEDFSFKQAIDDLFVCFERIDELVLKKRIQAIADRIVVCDKEEIIKIVEHVYVCLKEKIIEEYPSIKQEDLDTMPLYLSHNLYQDLPLHLHLNIKKLYQIVIEERFRNTNHLVKEAIQFIDQHYAKIITLDDVGDHLKVSPFYISKLLSSSLHKTFTELVTQRRIDASKERLKSDERMKEIAGNVGFQGQSYFNKIFKKYTGMTPKEYRHKIKA